MAALLILASLSGCRKDDAASQTKPRAEAVPSAPVKVISSSATPKAGFQEEPPEKWLEELSPEAREAWLAARHKSPMNTAKAKALGRLEPKAQEAYIKAVARMPGETALRERVREADRAELVRPAPAGFKPEDARRKVKLTLIPRSSTLRKGEKFWYRVELQNVGREAIEFRESTSFWKSGVTNVLKWDFFVTPPGGKDESAAIPTLHACPGSATRNILLPDWEKLSREEQRKTLEKIEQDLAFRRARRNGLDVDLAPGETLVTRAWTYENAQARAGCADKPWEVPEVPGEFRELATGFGFDKPGVYRIKFVLNDPPPAPPDEWDIQWFIKRGYSREEAVRREMERYQARVDESFGVVETNVIELEVAP